MAIHIVIYTFAFETCGVFLFVCDNMSFQKKQKHTMTLSLILAARESYFINNTKTMARGSCVIPVVTFFQH